MQQWTGWNDAVSAPDQRTPPRQMFTTSTDKVEALSSSTEMGLCTAKGTSRSRYCSAGALGLVDSEDSVASGLGVSPSGATLDRPGTTQRSGGRIAMTVLRPQQQLQQQQQAATALPQLPSPSTAQQAQQAASVPSQPGAASRGLKRSFLGAKQVDSPAAAGCIAAWTSTSSCWQGCL